MAALSQTIKRVNSDAIDRIGSDLYEEHDSWLQRILADLRRQEPEHFWQVGRRSTLDNTTKHLAAEDEAGVES